MSALEELKSCPLYPASQGVGLYCLSFQHVGVQISAMVHGANSCCVSGCVMYRVMAVEELLSLLMQLYKSQGKHGVSSSGFLSPVARM